MGAQKDPHDAPAIRAFASEVTAWREHAGLKKVEFAEVLGYTPQWISQIESAKTVPAQKFAVAALDPAVAVRDSKDPDGPKLVLASQAWRALLTAIKQA